MTTLNLLDINVDSLFEQCGIVEIDQVHKQLQQNIEEKKEELRMMVGERYRDLLQAADTIGEMRKTSANVIEHIDGIISSCKNLNEHQLIGFKIDTNSLANNSLLFDNKQKTYHGCMAQIYLLTKLPEMIWCRLDEADYLIATQLFIFARHISTGLQLDANMDIMRKFPVAKRQWNHLNQFFFMIKDMCLQQLERPELTTETAVKCLASLLLLENCQLDKLLTMFIQLRSRAFRRMLTTHNDNKSITKTAKERIISSLQLLNETILQLFKCFIDVPSDHGGNQSATMHGKCLLASELELISGPNSKPLLDMINLDQSLLIDALPAVISKFKPKIQIQPIDANAIQLALGGWLQSTEKDSRQLLSDVIENISSIRTIHNVNKAVLELDKPANWSKILQKLHLDPNIDFYSMFYQPLIQERIKTIIKTSWTTAIEQTEKNIVESFETGLVVCNVEKSFWIEEANDNPLSLKQALDTNRQTHQLLMKTKGFTSDICDVCNKFDEQIKSIYTDLSLYVNSTSNESIQLRDNPNVRKEHIVVVEFLRNCSQNAVTDLITKVKTLGTKHADKSHWIIFLAKLLKAVTEICPHIKQSLMPTALLVSNTWNESCNVSSVEHWEKICRLLDEESTNLWKQWIELFINDLVRPNKGLCFASNIDLVTVLSEFANWETFLIEEKDETDAAVQSTIRVPAHPSICLQRFLFNSSTQLNKQIPQTLPKQVTRLLTDRLLDCLTKTYSELVEKNQFVVSNQNASLQMYFDLKFLVLLFGSSTTVSGATSGSRRNDELQSLAMKFKAAIDPFDFELFHKYVNTNVKLAAQRMQHQYGLLVPSLAPLQTILSSTMNKQNQVQAQEKDPNLLSLATTGTTQNNWFTLLPIVVPTKSVLPTDASKQTNTGKQTTAKADKKKSPSKNSGSTPSTAATAQSAAQQNLANVKSNAAAFFGAMSQDWFR